MRHRSLTSGTAAASAGIWSKFRGTGKAWVHMHMTDQSLHICQSQRQYSQSRLYWVLLSEFETLAHVFVAKLQLWLAYHWRSGTSRIRIAVCRIPRDGPGIHVSAAAFSAGYFLASDRSSGTTGILPSSPEWGSWICMKPSCDSLWIDHSSPGTPRERQICHWSACVPVCSALYILVCFILIMFSFTLNQWTQCTQIVIYQDTSHSGAGGSSRSASADISTYAWSEYDGHR